MKITIFSNIVALTLVFFFNCNSNAQGQVDAATTISNLLLDKQNMIMIVKDVTAKSNTLKRLATSTKGQDSDLDPATHLFLTEHLTIVKLVENICNPSKSKSSEFTLFGSGMNAEIQTSEKKFSSSLRPSIYSSSEKWLVIARKFNSTPNFDSAQSVNAYNSLVSQGVLENSQTFYLVDKKAAYRIMAAKPLTSETVLSADNLTDIRALCEIRTNSSRIPKLKTDLGQAILANIMKKKVS